MLALLLSACQNLVPNPQAGATTATKNVDETQPISNILDIAESFSIEAQERAKPNKIKAWVDGLIVTAQPGMKELEIAKMVAGEEADYLRQSTLRKVTRTLRGQNFHDRYILIRTKDGQLGWVHEGGVRYIKPAFENLLDQFLPPSDPNKRTRGPAAVAPAADFILIPGKKVGPITKTTSESDLLQIYGSGQVHRGFVPILGASEKECTVVNPGTANEIKIVWENAERTRVKEVHLLKENSSWYTAEGLTCGLDFPEVVKANKAPISFHGFKWEYGGTVSSWGKGSLSRYNNKFYAVFAPRIPLAQVPSKFIGDKVLSSNTTDLDAIYPYIERLVVYLD